MNYNESDRVSLSFRIADDQKLALQRLAKEQNIKLSNLLEKLALDYIRNPSFFDDFKAQNAQLNTLVTTLEQERDKLQKQQEEEQYELLEMQGVYSNNEALIEMYDKLKKASVFNEKELDFMRRFMNFYTNKYPTIDRFKLIRSIFFNVLENELNLIFKTSLEKTLGIKKTHNILIINRKQSACHL